MSADKQTEVDWYHDWLGIAKGPRPPDHYTLLGLPRFESDAEKIRAAVRTRMKQVRPRCLKYPEAGTQLLNEIAAAQVCLLDPQKSAAYKRTLGSDVEFVDTSQLEVLDLELVPEDDVIDTELIEMAPADTYGVVGEPSPAEREQIARAKAKAAQAAGPESYLGVALGMNSLSLAYVDPKKGVQLLPIRAGSYAVPVAAAPGADGPVVGVVAMARQASGKADVVQGFHRLLGVPGASVQVGNHKYAPDVLAALVLLDPLKWAEDKGIDISAAVIAVPHWFEEAQREAVRQVGQRVGLCYMHLMDDPVAVALAFANKRLPEDEYFDAQWVKETFGDEQILVFDMDDETLEVSVLRWTRRKRLEVVGSGCNKKVGNQYWNDIFLNIVCAALEEQVGADPRKDGKLMQQLRLKAWSARTRLDTYPATKLALTYKGKALELDFARDEFELQAEPLLTKVEALLRTAVANTNVEWADIDRVLLAGECSRMPAIRAILEGRVAQETRFCSAPAYAKAMGAVLQGELLLD